LKNTKRAPEKRLQEKIYPVIFKGLFDAPKVQTSKKLILYKMKIFNLLLTILAFMFLSAATVANVKAQNKLFTVNDAGDSFDANIGDRLCADINGRCTLRAAVQESNACCFTNTVNFNLPPVSVINLTLGELYVTRFINIVGPGSKNLTVQRSPVSGTSNFRVFHLMTSENYRSFFRGFKIKNGSTNLGGAIYVESPGTALLLNDIVISENSASRGGGIYNEGKLSLARSLVNSNSTVNAPFAGGGGLFNAGGGSLAYIINSTITENFSTSGGAIYNEGNLVLINDTISHNEASGAGGSLFNAGDGPASVLNTIIGMDDCFLGSLSGSFNSLGGNLITDARNSKGFTNGVNGDQVSDNNAIDPLLAPLADNGGETATRALQAGSPAINKGKNCVTSANCQSPYPGQGGFYLKTDQRTNHRRLDGDTVDVGAVESNAQVFTQNGSLGSYFISPREGGCLAILTNASTNEKRYRLTNPYGNYEFNSVSVGSAYILERQCKRPGSGGVSVTDFEFYPF
jgi:predicted outer membrane repeat protein